MFLFQKKKSYNPLPIWKVGDVCEVQDPNQGAWYPGTIVSTEQEVYVVQISSWLKPNEVTVTEEGLAKLGTYVSDKWTRVDHTLVKIGEKYDAKDPCGRWCAVTIQKVGQAMVYVLTDTNHRFWTSMLAPLHEFTDPVCLAKSSKQHQQEEEKKEKKEKDYEWRFANNCLQAGDGVDSRSESGAWYSRVVREANGPEIILNNGHKYTLPTAFLAMSGTRVKTLTAQDKQTLQQFRNTIQRGTQCDAKDAQGRWYEGIFLKCVAGVYEVFFEGFGTVEKDVQDIAPLHFYTCKEKSAELVSKKYIKRYKANQLTVYDPVDVFDKCWYRGRIVQATTTHIQVFVPKLNKNVPFPYPSDNVLPAHTTTRTLTEEEQKALPAFHASMKLFHVCDAQLGPEDNWVRAVFLKQKDNKFVVGIQRTNTIVEVDNIAPILPLYAEAKEMVDTVFQQEIAVRFNTVGQTNATQACERLFDAILCYDKEAECLEQLKDFVCGSFQTNTEGQTFLHAAVRGKRLAICEWLIQHHPALLTVADKEGHYPIHFATSDPIVRLLVSNRPNSIFFKNKAGLSPFQLATDHKEWFWEIAQQAVKTNFVQGELCDALNSKGVWAVSEVVCKDDDNVVLAMGQEKELRYIRRGVEKYSVTELHFYTQGPFVSL